MPAASAITASRLLSGQLPDQRSGTSVTARPDEQLAPNRPICSVLPPCMARREFSDGDGACTMTFYCSSPPCGEGLGVGVERRRASIDDCLRTSSPIVASPPPPYPPPQGGRDQ